MVENSKNTFVCQVMSGYVHDDTYKVIDDIIYYDDKIYLIRDSKLKKLTIVDFLELGL